MGSTPDSASGRLMEEGQPFVVQLTQPVGIRLEALRASGLSDRLLLEALKNADIEVMRRVVQVEWDWDVLLQFARFNWNDCIRAVELGYTFKYLTIRGLTNLLDFRYRLKEGIDYFDRGTHLERVNLSRNDLLSLRSNLSPNWSIVVPEEQAGCETIYVTIKGA